MNITRPSGKRTAVSAATVTLMLGLVIPALISPASAAQPSDNSAQAVSVAARQVHAPASAPVARRGVRAATDRVLLDGYSWANCSSPITWRVDLSRLEPKVRERELGILTWAVDQWSAATGLDFTYGGEVAMKYSDSGSSLRSADGSALASRSMDFAYLPERSSTLLRGNSYGFGGPNFVMVSRKEIVNGFAVFESDLFDGSDVAPIRLRKSLYLHEIGHALGLGHSARDSDVMNALVTRTVELSSRDVENVRARLAPCQEIAAAPSTSSPDAPSR